MSVVGETGFGRLGIPRVSQLDLGAVKSPHREIQERPKVQKNE
jgi:hypothetical protein